MPAPADFDEWLDLTPMLAYGVYVLFLRGQPVFVGHGRVPLEHIAARRDLVGKISAPWMPIRGVRFDAVRLRPSHPDRAPAEVAALIAALDPPGNRLPQPLATPAIRPLRRA